MIWRLAAAIGNLPGPLPVLVLAVLVVVFYGLVFKLLRLLGHFHL
jgi:hypothetical protein